MASKMQQVHEHAFSTTSITHTTSTIRTYLTLHTTWYNVHAKPITTQIQFHILDFFSSTFQDCLKNQQKWIRDHNQIIIIKNNFVCAFLQVPKPYIN